MPLPCAKSVIIYSCVVQLAVQELLALEAVLDTFSYLLIDTLEAAASEQVKANAASLHGTIDTAIKQYDPVVTARANRKLLGQDAIAVAA